jgi:hypothetical protein
MKALLFEILTALLLKIAKTAEPQFERDFDGGPSSFVFQQIPLQKPRSISHMRAYDIITGPVSFPHSTSSSLVAPRLPQLNSTTGEQWEFDATSGDGNSGLLVAFYRDPEFAFLGPGNLRINMDIVWSNGTRYSLVDYASDSVIEERDGNVTGTWLKPGHAYKFRISREMDQAEVWLDTPVIKGSILLTSTAKPRYADGSEYPSSNASTRNIPRMHWFEPIPAADAVVDLVVRGSALKWNGIGGSERIWQSHTWFEILRGYKFLRARIGPYSISYWTANSRIENRDEFGNLLLSRNGKKVFASSQRIEDPTATTELTSKYFTYTPTFGGNVRGLLKNNLATGYDLVIVSPKTGKRWIFHFEHKQLEFEFSLGNDAGGTAFVGIATGGEEGKAQESGVFLNEAVDFTNLWIPTLVVTALHWYHRLRAWANLQVNIILDTINAYSL